MSPGTCSECEACVNVCLSQHHAAPTPLTATLALVDVRRSASVYRHCSVINVTRLYTQRDCIYIVCGEQWMYQCNFRML